MSEFRSVEGHLTEVHRYINVPMRWCEQYPSRERRELWVTPPSGADIKFVVHSRAMPARRGHRVTVLLLDGVVVGMCNWSTGKSVNFIREDPTLLLRRCDGLAVLCILAIAIAASMVSEVIVVALGVPTSLLYLPMLASFRFARRGWLRSRVGHALNAVRDHQLAEPMLRRVR